MLADPAATPPARSVVQPGVTYSSSGICSSSCLVGFSYTTVVRQTWKHLAFRGLHIWQDALPSELLCILDDSGEHVVPWPSVLHMRMLGLFSLADFCDMTGGRLARTLCLITCIPFERAQAHARATTSFTQACCRDASPRPKCGESLACARAAHGRSTRVPILVGMHGARKNGTSLMYQILVS